MRAIIGRVNGLRFRFEGSGFRLLELRIQGLGFTASDLRLLDVSQAFLGWGIQIPGWPRSQG